MESVYDEAVSLLESLPVKKKFTLKPTRDLCALLGIDLSRLRCILVTGTNGKGSVCALCESAIRAAGYRTGLYTSPHLIGYNERIAINGRPVSKGEFGRMILESRAAVLGYNAKNADCEMISEFEAITACAIKRFLDGKVDFAVIEIGMGGRLDATNVLTPELSVITKVAIDHAQALGDTVGKIAVEKAGIIKEGRPVVTGAGGEALEAIRRIAGKHGSPVITVGTGKADVVFTAKLISLQGTAVDVGGIFGKASLGSRSLLGAHQCFNMAVAFAALCELGRLRLLRVPMEKIQEGFRLAHWTGRFETVSSEPLVVLDGGHNPDAAAALSAAIGDLLPGKRLAVVCTLMRDKDIAGFLSAIAPRAEIFLATTLPMARAAATGEIAAQARRHCGEVIEEPNCLAAFLRAKSAVGEGRADAVLVCGSLYLVGGLKKLAGVL